jgi:hypothetical protein
LEKETSNNGYYMVGDTMEFEPGLMLNGVKKRRTDQEIMMDTAYLTCKSAKTASSSISAEKKQSEEWPQVRRFSVTRPKNKKKIKKRKNVEDMIRRRFN